MTNDEINNTKNLRSDLCLNKLNISKTNDEQIKAPKRIELKTKLTFLSQGVIKYCIKIIIKKKNMYI